MPCGGTVGILSSSMPHTLAVPVGGNAVIQRDGIDYATALWIIDQVSPVTKDSSIGSWDIWATNTSYTVRLVIWRKSGSVWSVVGMSAFVTATVLGANHFVLTTAIIVKAGDFVGVNSPGPWGYLAWLINACVRNSTGFQCGRCRVYQQSGFPPKKYCYLCVCRRNRNCGTMHEEIRQSSCVSPGSLPTMRAPCCTNKALPSEAIFQRANDWI